MLTRWALTACFGALTSFFPLEIPVTSKDLRFSTFLSHIRANIAEGAPVRHSTQFLTKTTSNKCSETLNFCSAIARHKAWGLSMTISRVRVRLQDRGM